MEKFGNVYALRAGFSYNKAKLLKLLKRIRKNFASAELRKCDYLSRRIVYRCKRENFVRLTLQDIGYPHDVLLKQTVGSYNIFFPILPGFRSGNLFLRLKISENAPIESTVTVLIDNHFFKTYKVSEVGYAPVLKIPLRKAPWGHFCKITLVFNFVGKSSVCQILNESGFYVTIFKDSFAQIKFAGSNSTILTYLLNYNPQFNITSPSAIYDAQAAYFLAKLYKDFSLYNLKFSLAGKKVEIKPSDAAKLLNGTLIVPPKDLNLLGKELVLETRSFEKRIYQPQIASESNLPLKKFGFSTQTLKGIGEVGFKIPIDFSIYSGKPRKVLLYLRFSVSGGEIRKDRVWASVYWNKQLIWSKPVSSPGLKSYVIDVPFYIVSYGKNMMKFSVSYYPSEGMCNGTVLPITVTLFDSSGVSAFGVDRKFLNVRDLVSSFNGSLGVYLDKRISKDFVLKLFKDIGYYNPKVTDISSSDSDAPFYVVVKSFKDLLGYKVPIQGFKGGFKIVNPLTGKTFLSVSGKYSFLIIQNGRFKGRPALFVCPSDKNAERLINELRYFDFDRFVGNANVITEHGIYTLQVGKKFRVIYNTKSWIRLLFERFKFLILMVILFIVTLAAVVTAKRLT